MQADLCNVINDSRPDKYCGLGLAGFPKQLPAVAKTGGFPLKLFPAVTGSGARLPLSPHCNPRPALEFRTA